MSPGKPKFTAAAEALPLGPASRGTGDGGYCDGDPSGFISSNGKHQQLASRLLLGCSVPGLSLVRGIGLAPRRICPCH
ncbi:hypothetical protein KC345_g72 [Hortaea werneckii]|nr:hypothetical protein KC345_g72 [Hortaea werneckii]